MRSLSIWVCPILPIAAHQLPVTGTKAERFPSEVRFVAGGSFELRIYMPELTQVWEVALIGAYAPSDPSDALRELKACRRIPTSRLELAARDGPLVRHDRSGQNRGGLEFRSELAGRAE
jgi:hypothetical protein